MSDIINNISDDVKESLNIEEGLEMLKSSFSEEEVKTETEKQFVGEGIIEESPSVEETTKEEQKFVGEGIIEPVKEEQPETKEEKIEEIDISDDLSSFYDTLDDTTPAFLKEYENSANENVEEESSSIKHLLNRKKNSLIDDSKVDSFDLEDEKPSKNETFDDESNNESNIEYRSFAQARPARYAKNSKLSFMDNLNVDLNNITIVEKSPLKRVADTNIIFESAVPTFFVVCCQSGYSATLSGLSLSEKNAINNSNLDLFQSKQKLYKTVYNKIQSMSFDKPKFDDWLKMTSMGDWSTLLFAIYCQTFIDNNDFDITCGSCGKTTSVTVDNNSLVEAKDKNVFAKIDEIVGGNKTPQDLVNTAVVYNKTRCMLNDSKIIVDIKLPTLWDNLALIRSTNPKTLQEYSDTFSAMLFINHMYMLDVQTTYNTGKPSYYEITERASILDTLLKLSNSDGEQLEDLIEEKLGKYNINYEIHGCTCAHCKKIIPNIPVDMETVLFTRINKERKRKTTN